MRLIDVEIGRLVGHPMNSNRMGEEAFEKLCGHIGRTGRYPAVVVRAMRPQPDTRPFDARSGGRLRTGVGEKTVYQILDGHHRVEALRRLGHERVRCEVWEVDEEEALVLLATLNRLEGREDAKARAKLLREIAGRVGLAGAARMVPESGEALGRYLALNRAAEVGVPGAGVGEMPVCVHFFLRPGERGRLEERLREIGGRREEALMRLVDAFASTQT